MKLISGVPMDTGYHTCYESALHGILSFHGVNVPKWYMSTVANYHNTFLYSDVSAGKARQAFWGFTTGRNVLNGTSFALDQLGLDYQHVSGHNWLDSWKILTASIDKDLPVMVGPMDIHFLKHINEYTGEPLPHAGLKGHYSLVTGVNQQEIVLNDSGMLDVHVGIDSFREAWSSTTHEYTTAEGTDETDEYKNSMFLVKGKSHTKSEKDIALNTVKRLSALFQKNGDREFNGSHFYRGVPGILQLATDMENAFNAKNKKWLVEQIGSNRIAGVQGNQCRTETAMFLEHASRLLPNHEEKLFSLAKLFRKSGQGWLALDLELYRAMDKAKGRAWRESLHSAAAKAREIHEIEDEARGKLILLGQEL